MEIFFLHFHFFIKTEVTCAEAVEVEAEEEAAEEEVEDSPSLLSQRSLLSLLEQRLPSIKRL